MDKLLHPGRTMYASGMTGLGILCIIYRDFIVGRPPAWPVGVDVNPLLGFVSGTLLILAAISVISNKKTGLAASVIALLILLLSVFRHLPSFMNDWVNAYKSLSLFGGSLIIAGSFFLNDSQTTKWLSVNEIFKKRLILSGCILISVFFIACGYAHFKWADGVQFLIPDYIPFRMFWTYFAGVCLYAGGVGLLIPRTRKWAALLSGIMISGWFLLLHIPRFLANTNDPSDRMGLCESFTFVGILFVLAGKLSRRE